MLRCPSAIRRDLDELADKAPSSERVEQAVEQKPMPLQNVRSLVEPDTRGGLQSPLLWTCTSLRKLADGMRATL